MHKLFTKTWAQLTAYFLAGVFVILPLVITALVVIWVAGMLHDFLGPSTPLGKLIGHVGLQFAKDQPAVANVIGWLVVLAAIFGLGMLAVELGIRRYVTHVVDWTFGRIPLVGQIYGTSKQLVDMLDQSDKEKLKGMAPVFCYFGRERNVGVLALLVSPRQYSINGRTYQIVIVPTAPIPFGGGMLFVPVDLIEPAGMSVEGLMSVYVSMGATAPHFLSAATDLAGPSPQGTVDGVDA